MGVGSGGRVMPDPKARHNRKSADVCTFKIRVAGASGRSESQSTLPTVKPGRKGRQKPARSKVHRSQLSFIHRSFRHSSMNEQRATFLRYLRRTIRLIRSRMSSHKTREIAKHLWASQSFYVTIFLALTLLDPWFIHLCTHDVKSYSPNTRGKSRTKGRN